MKTEQENMSNELNINGQIYVPKQSRAEGERKCIVIADNRGLTFVGTFDPDNLPEFPVLKDAQCVIRWGTSEHLAELVAGPTENTKLGAIADVRLNRSAIVAIYELSGGWE